MVTIREINHKEKRIIREVVDIHIKTFKGFFLTFMGKGFLNTMYSSYCKHPESGLLVAFYDNKPVGFLAYSGNLSGLYKKMIQKQLLPFAWYSIVAFLKKPSVFMRLMRAFLKPKESDRLERFVELASIGVQPEWKGKGIGSLLINYLKKNTDFSKYEYINLETDALNNEGANKFYLHNSFTLVRTYKTNEGRMMNEYQFKQ